MKPHLTHFLHCLILGAIVGLTAALFLSGINASIHCGYRLYWMYLSMDSASVYSVVSVLV